MARISVIGTGYLGVTHAACMASLGHDVVALDVDEAKVTSLAAGKVPFHEPGLPELLQESLAAGKIKFTTSWVDLAAQADVHFLCVGTPQSPESPAADLSQIQSAIRSLAPLLTKPCLIVGKSTVPVGTAQGLRDELAKIRMNMSGLKSTIKNLLDKSIAFFSAKEKVTFDQFLDNPMIDEIQEYMYLHPKLRNVCVDDLLVKEIERKGKIDVYVDVSGSMGSSAEIKGLSRSERISRLTFAKSLVLKLKEMDMLNDVYSFQNRVSKEGNTISDIVFIDGNGGTCLNNVVKKIEENGTNALIITDAEDRCQMYSDKAFFIGVAGSDFRSFEDNVVAEYSRRNQIVVFDGNRIMKVDSKGCTV